MRAIAAIVAAVVAATVLPAWWFFADVADGSRVLIGAFALVTTVAGAIAVAAVSRGQPAIAAGALVVTAFAPTGFLYVGNVGCLAIALYLVVARRRFV